MIQFQPKSRQYLRQTLRTQNKIKENLEKLEADVASKIKKILNQIFSVVELKKIATKTKFLVRSRKLTSFATIGILLMGCMNGTEDVSSLGTMCCYLRKWFDIHMVPQSLQEQMNSKKCADFIKEIAIRVMMHEANKAIQKLLKKPHKSNLYDRILLQDSTVISLPETISKIFEGCGGSASKGAVKCDFIIDQTNHLIVRCKCISGKIPDISLSEDILQYSRENDLIIRDMGYFNLSHFTQMNKKNVKFISRLKQTINVFLNKDDKNPINLIDHLKIINAKRKKIDIDIYLGKEERIHVRLIGVKVPKEVVESRREQYIKSKKAKPSEVLMEWYEHTLMVTNIPKKDITLQSILKLYKIRWQIELFFKNMKSQLKVDNFTGENKYRILCLLYSKLALTWMTALLFALAQNIIEKEYIISNVKFTRWLRDVGDWQKSVAEGDFSELLKSFERDKDLLRKKIKKKKQP